MYCGKCGTQVEAPRTVCPNCGAKVTSPTFENPHPMAWYKWQIYFAQWFGMASNAFWAFAFLWRGQILLTLLHIVFVFLNFATRQALANYSSTGPKLLYTQYIISEVVKILMGDINILSIGLTALVVYLNYIYFKKREDLFY